ncbi:MAG: hypothetical protein ACJAZ2_000829 [Glaciecola sp.]|jgi:uncharacterized protein YecT (DUF1311 family)
MKQIITLLLITYTLNCVSQTQREMNLAAHAEYEVSEKEMNDVYEKIQVVYKSDTAFVEALIKSQNLWVSFRAAELEMKFPAANPRWEYGSVFPMCFSGFLQYLTDKRTKSLQQWLIGEEEGDVCVGSVKIIPETIHYGNITKMIIHSDSTVSLFANIKKDHRIYGYQSADEQSKKVLLFSVFTNEVEGNPAVLIHGAYYDTKDMKNKTLKYLSKQADFVEVEIIQNDKVLDVIYIEKYWVKFNGI